MRLKIYHKLSIILISLSIVFLFNQYVIQSIQVLHKNHGRSNNFTKHGTASQDTSSNKTTTAAPGKEHNIISGWERAALVRARCREIFGEVGGTLANEHYPFEKRVFLANKEKMAYCAIAKAFSTNMKRIFLYLSDYSHSAEDLKASIKPLQRISYPHQQNYWKKGSVLDHLSKEDQDQVMESYMKFIFVRDPLDKVISAYRDKFYGKSEDVFHTYFRDVIAAAMCRDIERYRLQFGSPSFLVEGELNCTNNPVFIGLQTFLAWTILVPLQNKVDSNRNDNPHWTQSIPLCRICSPSVNFDFVGKFEEGDRDLGDIMKHAGWDFPFPNVNDTQFDTILSDKEKMDFTEQVNLLSSEFVSELKNAVAVERYILGYTDLKPG